MAKVIALRNFSGPETTMILRGDIFDLDEPYLSEWTKAGFVAYYTEREPAVKPEGTFKNMKTKVK